jgi:SAM-dependent methyltransferase
MSELDPIARFYDLDFGGIDYDLPFYENFARRCGSPILELGVGTGRVALSLARAGFSVTGIDSSPAMLAVARSKLEGLLQQRVRLVEGDIRDFKLKERFALALAPLGGFMHLTTSQDQLKALACTHGHLAQGGTLIVDLPNPEREREDGANELVLAWVRRWPNSESTVCKMVSAEVDEAAQLEQVTHFYDEVAPSGAVRRTIFTFTLRYLYRNEMEHLLERSGFAIEGLYGSCDLDGYDAESPRMIFVARKRS